MSGITEEARSDKEIEQEDLYDKELLHKTYLLFTSHIDSLNAIDKYQGEFNQIEETTLLMHKEKTAEITSHQDELMLQMIIDKYKVEDKLLDQHTNKEETKLLNDIAEKINEMLENNSRFQFFYKHLKVGDTSYYSDHPYLQRLIIALNANKKIVEREKLQLRNNQLKNIISSLENFISNLYFYHLYYFDHNPNSFNNETLTYKEVSSLEDLNQLKKYVTEKKVTDIMFKSFEKWLKNFVNDCTRENYDKKFKKDFSFQIETISEAFQRRHIVTHNNSVVNHLYLENVAATYTKDLKNGDLLVSGEAYIKDIVDNVKDFSLEIFKRFINKSAYKNTIFINLLNTSALEMINDEDYTYASKLLETIYDFTTSAEDKNILKYNLFITNILSPNHIFDVEECKTYFDDIVNPDEDDIVARKILLNEPDKMNCIREYLGSFSLDHKVDAIYSWPLFKLIEDEDEYIDYKREVLYHNIETEG